MSQIKVGDEDVHLDTPAHTWGVREGNSTGHEAKQPGRLRDGRSTARRSTGIRAKHRDPILPSMPNLSPA